MSRTFELLTIVRNDLEMFSRYGMNIIMVVDVSFMEME